MLEDWEKAVQKMDKRVTAAASVKEGVLGICKSIEEFSDIYAGIWNQPSVAAAATPDLQHRHEFLGSQVGERVERLLEEKGYGNKKEFNTLVIELILVSNGKEEVREQLGSLMEQLYP
jgi:hypothetical protein